MIIKKKQIQAKQKLFKHILQFDLKDDLHYKDFYQDYVDDDEFRDLCKIPQVKQIFKLFLHRINAKNYFQFITKQKNENDLKIKDFQLYNNKMPFFLYDLKRIDKIEFSLDHKQQNNQNVILNIQHQFEIFQFSEKKQIIQYFELLLEKFQNQKSVQLQQKENFLSFNINLLNQLFYQCLHEKKLIPSLIQFLILIDQFMSYIIKMRQTSQYIVQCLEQIIQFRYQCFKTIKLQSKKVIMHLTDTLIKKNEYFKKKISIVDVDLQNGKDVEFEKEYFQQFKDFMIYNFQDKVGKIIEVLVKQIIQIFFKYLGYNIQEKQIKFTDAGFLSLCINCNSLLMQLFELKIFEKNFVLKKNIVHSKYVILIRNLILINITDCVETVEDFNQHYNQQIRQTQFVQFQEFKGKIKNQMNYKIQNSMIENYYLFISINIILKKQKDRANIYEQESKKHQQKQQQCKIQTNIDIN